MLRIENSALVEAVVAAYDTAESQAEWSMRILKTLTSIASSSMAAAMRFTSGFDDDVFHIRSMTHDATVNVQHQATALAAHLQTPGQLMERMLGRTQGTTIALTTGLGEHLQRVPGFRDCWPAPVVDSLGFVSRDTNGDGFCACVGLDQIGKLSARESRLLNQLATHVGAGDRLRRAKHLKPLDEAEAIFTPAGKVLHARELAKNKRDQIDDGRRRRDAMKKSHDPETALSVWKGLIAGRWSLVDHFDTDGKRFLLAMKNAPKVDRRSDLTPRERRICALVAMGHSDKEISYMLGLSTGAVSACLSRARAKLNVRSRVEITRLWRTP